MVQDARPAVPAEAPAPCPPDIDMLGTQEVQMGDPEKQPGPELERQTQKLRDHAVVRPQGGMPMRSSDLRSGEEAVVIGGSMAGLLAARVLADRFDRVTVIDRDRFPDGAKFRKGVPQSRHLHGLLADADRRRVEGLRIRARSSGGGQEAAAEELRAGLVVDASGRNSRAPEWLAELGYSPPAKATVTSFLGYASCYYAIPADFDADWRVLFLQADPAANARGGVLFPIEGNRWMVTLAGRGRDYPPTDEEGFLAFAGSLRSPLLHEAIRGAERLTPIHAYRQTDNQRRFYERLPRLPQRFLVIGDGVCAFNPLYGQGMTVAAQSALVLDRLLRERSNGALGDLPARFQREVARVSAAAWLMATGEDLRYPTTEGGERTLQLRLTHRYLDRVIGAAIRDKTVGLAFGKVAQLVAPPTTLFRPGILLRALLHGGARGTGAPPTTTGVSNRDRQRERHPPLADRRLPSG